MELTIYIITLLLGYFIGLEHGISIGINRLKKIPENLIKHISNIKQK